MKEFNLEQAKAGKPVCTKDGHRARILCFDLNNGGFPICAAVEDEEGIEVLYTYTLDGRYVACRGDDFDLMMAPEKHVGWVNIVSCDGIDRFVGGIIYPSEEAAREKCKLDPDHYITAIKIEWEE